MQASGYPFRVARLEVLEQGRSSERMSTDPPNLVTVAGGRMSEAEAEQAAAVDLVRAMGEGDIRTTNPTGMVRICDR